jgi:menaquinone-dependent protoporphyrinogen oxidase
MPVTSIDILPAPRPAGGAPRVLVVYAGRLGATREVAAAMGGELVRAAAGRGSELATVAVPVDAKPDAMAFDAVVLGSAVCDGRWPEPALRWARDMSGELRERPVWLFSTGVPTPPPARRPVGDGRWVAEALGAREHRLLDGADTRALRDWCTRIAAEVVGRRELVASR